MANVLAVVEQREGVLRPVSREVVSAAAEVAEGLGGEVHALLMGGPGAGDEAAELARHGAGRIRVVEDEALAAYEPDGYAPVVAEVAGEGDYDAVLFPASSQGKDLAPRVAARLEVPLAQDATGLTVSNGELDIIRPVYAGKAYARVAVNARPALVSLRPNVFPATEREGAGEVESMNASVDSSGWGSRVVDFQAKEAEYPDVAEAPIIVSGGRGMKDPENWQVLEELREAIGGDAALGASRAVVDAGWRPHAEQVGQTGKTVAPRLYFAVGISGAIQHLAGMRTAGTIVAVNKDPEAPIFKVADYGIVGDLFEVVPRLAEEIRKVRGS